MSGEQLPRNDEAERCVLASILLEPEKLAAVRQIVRPGDFFEIDGPNRSMYVNLLALDAEGKPADMQLLAERMKDSGEWDAGHVAEIISMTATPANVEHYAQIVQDNSIKRQAAYVTHAATQQLNNGRPGVETIAETIASLDSIKHRIDAGAETFEAYAPHELCKMDLRTDFLIDNVLVRQQNGLVSGVYKSLKTSICADAAVSISTGTPFLGKWGVATAANVLFMSAESGLRKLTGTCRRISEARDIDFASNQKLTVAPIVPKLGDAGEHDKLRRTIVEREIELLIIDPCYRAMASIGNDASNVFKVGELLSCLDEIAEATGATILVVHHNGKHSADNQPPELKDVAFAGFAEWARQWLLLGPRRKWNPETGEHFLWLNYGGSEGHAGTWGVDVTEGRLDSLTGQRWDVDVLSREDVRQGAKELREAVKRDKSAEQLTGDRASIINVLKGQRDATETKTGLRDRTGINTQKFAQAFGSLLTDGTLKEVRLTKGNNREYAAYTFA